MEIPIQINQAAFDNDFKLTSLWGDQTGRSAWVKKIEIPKPEFCGGHSFKPYNNQDVQQGNKIKIYENRAKS